MPRKSIPAYCHHKGSGQAYVKINGKPVYLGLHGTPDSHRRYSEEIAIWQAEQEQAPTEITIGQLTLLYNEHAKSHYRKNGNPTSKLHVVQAAMRALNREFRTLPATDFSPRRFKQVREKLIESGVLCRNTINEYMRIIRGMVKWAVGEELLPPEKLIALQAVADLQRGRTPARESKPVNPVPLANVEAIKPHIARPLWGAIQIQLATAARPGEALQLRLVDIDRSGDVWIYRPGSHKTEHHQKPRIILCGPKAQAVIQEHLTSADPEAYVFAVPGTYGEKPYRRDSYTNAVKRACETAFNMPTELRYITRGLKRVPKAERSAERDKRQAMAAQWRAENCWSPNQLRHTAATEIRRAAGKVEISKTILGHADIRTTELYAERDLAEAIRIIRKIG